jgi:hypothetical protein
MMPLAVLRVVSVAQKYSLVAARRRHLGVHLVDGLLTS